MRLTGWVLLAIGLLLCATISWAALGFMLMGVGLISLQVAERRRRPAGKAVPAGTSGFTPPRLSVGLQPPTLDPVTGKDAGPPRQPRQAASPDKTWPDEKSGAAYDEKAWRGLVETDPDLAQLANVLADYGPQYVDELATSYLAAPDKSRLGAIVDGIIARARDGQPVPPPAPPPTPADALEASLIATVEEASAKLTVERANLLKPAKVAESRPLAASPREPAFGRAPRDSKSPPPPPMPSDTPADLEASLIAAVTEAAARRADAPKPTLEPTPPAAKREPEIRIVASNEPKPAEPKPAPLTPPAKATADDLDESLLAALAEISGQKFKDEPKPDAASEDPSADDGLSEMIKKFAPDSHFLRKK